jgi:hypothetical protein
MTVKTAKNMTVLPVNGKSVYRFPIPSRQKFNVTCRMKTFDGYGFVENGHENRVWLNQTLSTTKRFVYPKLKLLKPNSSFSFNQQ